MPSRTDISPLSQLLKRMDAASKGVDPRDTIPTGFPSLDTLLGGGVRRGDLVVLGADVGGGKSALALAIALTAASGGYRCSFFSAEMSRDRILERALAIDGKARIDDVRRGTLDDQARCTVGVAALKLREAHPLIERIGPAGVADIEKRVRDASGLELVIVDSLQGLSVRDSAQDEELSAAAGRLKRLAIEAHVTMFVTAQLPSLERERADPRPRLADFGVRGAVSHHADVVLALFREEMYRTDAAEGATELAVLKNRNGPTSYIDLFFFKQWLRFEDMV